jgi:voltage-gated potassium channel
LAHEYDTATSEERLRRWNRAFDPLVIVAAILPLGLILGGDDPTEGPGAPLALGCWLVFAIDFTARLRLDRRLLATWKGRVYLGIVVVTFPVYVLIPRLDEADVLAVTRLGWVAVLVVAGIESAREAPLLLRRVGIAGLYATTAVFAAATAVNRVEDAENGFRNFGDSLWWAIATITTVGYGDRVPVTSTGRLIAVLLMVSGLAFLGVIAASLASYFGVTDTTAAEDRDDAPNRRLDELIEEVRQLRAAVARNDAVDDDRADGSRST